MAKVQDAGEVPPRVTRTRLISGAVIGGFLLLTAGVVVSLIIADRQPADELAIDGEVAGPDTDEADDTADDETQTSDGEETGDDAQDPGLSDTGTAEEATANEGGASSGEDAGNGASSDAQGADDATSGTGERIEVSVDGRCTAEVDSVEEAASIKAWELDGCASAPVALDDADERWIAVVASFSAGMDESEARERADNMGFDLLWSSHYPSLNPQLWVVFDGPFDDEAAATQAADRIGDGAYPRVMSDNDDDRYCIADDGCIGGTVE